MKTIVLEEKEFFEKFYEVSGWTKENAPNMDNLHCPLDGCRYIRKDSEAHLSEIKKGEV